jgi:4-amino-4-deoxy-L-arabinose transferase-like glycosyltransferase
MLVTTAGVSFHTSFTFVKDWLRMLRIRTPFRSPNAYVALHFLTVIACRAAVFFALGNHQLQGSTEARVAGIAMEMHLDDDWVTPRLFGEPFLEKPPLSLWLDAGAIARSAFRRGRCGWLGGGRVVQRDAVVRMLRRFGRPTTLAWTAALLLATMASYWSNVRGVGEDALLALGVTLTLLAFFQGHRQSSLSNALLFALGIAIATLSKGILGLAMPGVVIFAFLLAESLMDKRLHLAHWLRPGC